MTQWKVARWKDDFKIDGIDLDLEEGAGSRKEAGPNMVHFVRWEKQKKRTLFLKLETILFLLLQFYKSFWRSAFALAGDLNSFNRIFLCHSPPMATLRYLYSLLVDFWKFLTKWRQGQIFISNDKLLKSPGQHMASLGHVFSWNWSSQSKSVHDIKLHFGKLALRT